MNGGLLLHGITSDTDCAWTTYCMHHWEKTIWPNSAPNVWGEDQCKWPKCQTPPARPPHLKQIVSTIYPLIILIGKKSNAAHLKYDFKHGNLCTSWTKFRLYNGSQHCEPKNLFTLAKKGISNGWWSCKVSNALFFHRLVSSPIWNFVDRVPGA